MKTVYLSLGSNLGDRKSNLLRALQLLVSSEITVSRVSAVYETEPRDVAAQPWFLNIVVECSTRLFPVQLLARLQKIEKELGRKRIMEKGPRTIDIDILLYGNFIINTPNLQIPHPRLAERRFVLDPLAELAPGLRHPVSRRSMRELAAAIVGQKARKLGDLVD